MAWTDIEGRRGSFRVRVFIERRDGGVGLADCERVNEKLSALFDLEDPILGSCFLEVSTPGLDRPLRSVADCHRFLGRRVRVRYRIANDPREAGPQTVVGTLRTVEDATICLDGPAGGLRIGWNEVVAARLDPDLGALLRRGARAQRRRRT